MPALQDDGRLALAEAITRQTIHLAWGRGRPEWDTSPQTEPSDRSELVDEVGRRIVTFKGYARPVVSPDEPAEIELPDGSRYTASSTPTTYVYVRTVFNFEDAAGETIRELGLFVGGKPASGLPAGQRYFTPAQVAEKGRLYLVDHPGTFTRSAHVRNTFEYILPF